MARDAATSRQDGLYAEAAASLGPALERLARGYEANPEHRRDLVQEIHVALWKSLAGFDGRCSLRTWVYRVAHNVAASHVGRQKRLARGLCGVEELDAQASGDDPEQAAGDRRAMERLLALIHALKPADRQVMLLYLEDLEAAAIGEVTGLSSGAVAVKIHRIKQLLSKRFAGSPQP